ncbi:DNA-binding protein [Schizopora paradoxa]|uniref:DNA-binding protein n=1 Tax=Schizopora paradoxa TaxID=27342 RepID=A0A0H2S4P0_9AGAM|nr:DNA-binding protein [Schizopora paradoxa]
MQAQARRQQVQNTISAQQSLTVVKTLLTASFGCIAFLRNLLPESNFAEASLTSGDRNPSNVPSSQLSTSEGASVSKVHFKKVVRGVSTEADKLLNYLEEGVFHAIEQQHLKSCIIAIYLDSDDPNNIIEAYTYNFTYYTLPGTTTTVPIMTLDNQLSNLSLGTKGRGDPVARATLEGKAPTLGDVKQSLRNMVRNVIMITQTMDPLPRHRFATFKLIYNEDAPPDYEPPHFRPGDPEKDRFVFYTHDKHEKPDKFSVGSLKTPHHGIDLQIKSVVKYIPNGEDDNVQFTGVVDGATQGTAKKKGMDVNARSRQVELQRKDAEERTVVWDMDDDRWSDRDAEGSPDPDFVDDSGIGMHEIPIATESQPRRPDDMDMDNSAQFYGRKEHPPSRVGNLKNAKDRRGAAGSLQPTQLLEPTQAISPGSSMVLDTNESYAQEQSGISALSKGVDTQLMINMMERQSGPYSFDGTHEILDLETQPVDAMSYDEMTTVVAKKSDQLARTSKSNEDDADCACGFPEADDLVFCDGCSKWYHLWCMGFHSDQDMSLPSSYICWPCRLQALPTFELMREDYPAILFRLEEVARFRRAIKFAEVHNPESLKTFRTLVGGNANLAEQLWKQLEQEGFIEEVVIETDALGLVESRSRQTRSKKKVQSTRETKYAFVQSIKKKPIYQEYFSPEDDEVEKDLLEISGAEKKIKKKTRRAERKERHDATEDVSKFFESLETGPTPHLNAQRVGDAEHPEIDMDSQTQDETQYPLALTGNANSAAELKKRSLSHETVRNSKKMKISVGEGVDLED